MSRILAATAALVAILLPAASAEATPLPPENPGTKSGGRAAAPSWAQAEIRFVVAHGLMSPAVSSFRPADPLTQGELSALIAGLTKRPAQPVASPSAPVTIAQLDAKLVQALGLADEGGVFARAVRGAGLAPPARFGNEVVARLLGLRTNHPAAQDDLELLPGDPATRAEAAFSAARILRFQGWEVPSIETAAASFTLVQPSPWQRRVLATAVRFIGYPYVWGGTSEIAEAPFGVSAHGGFDCSGFVWRVYKLQLYPGGNTLGAMLRGRTTMAMSGEVPRSRRVAFSRLAPADLLFFGAHGPSSRPAAVDHMGIYLGGGWFIHSSGQGVALSPLTGWYRQRFAWARRPLVEAGLEPPQ